MLGIVLLRRTAARCSGRQMPMLLARSARRSMMGTSSSATPATAPISAKDAAAAVARAGAFESFASTSLTVSVVDRPGALVEVLQIFARANINIKKIESCSAHSKSWDYDFTMTFDGSQEDELIKKVLEELRTCTRALTINGTTKTPWFPKKIADLDRFADRELEYGESLGSDHPGFSDLEYRKRRTEIVQIAKKYRYGDPIPTVDYTPIELETWRTVYNRLMELIPKYACREYQYFLPLLQDRCGYGPDHIPQLNDISRFLQDSTGFRLRPVSGLLTSRDFLNGLAHRTFHSTQYIRHHSNPFYTPEPDICHELLGHVPLFADTDFANFSQEIGLASLGASEEDVAKLATLYWFTVEFGVVKQMGAIKAYGAGIMSSFGEIEWCFSGKPEMRPFDLQAMTVTPFPITEYQPIYWIADSFKSMTQKVREFGATLSRPFVIKYNPYSLTAEKFDI